MANLNWKQGESKPVTLTARINNARIDLTGATLTLVIKKDRSSSTVISTISDSDFDKTNQTNGEVIFHWDSSDLDLSTGQYWAELKVVFPGTPDTISKSDYATIHVDTAVT
jgi:phosphopantothenoylcysteine synthetase/decarboxylase